MRLIVELLLGFGQAFWRALHEDTCAARFCGGWRCCTCAHPPEYVTERRYQ